MNKLWLLKGNRDAPGWRLLEEESKADKVDLVIFDREGWALLRTSDPPTKYEGLVPEEPADGMYVSEQGFPVYIVDCEEVEGPGNVIRALGREAEDLLKKIKDPDAVLQRLGRAF
jgi:hypothetical protein